MVIILVPLFCNCDNLSSVFCCALRHFFIKKVLFACTLLEFKQIQKTTHTNPTH